MRNRTNILFIIHGLNVGGMEKHLLALSSAITAKYYNIFIITHSPDGALRAKFIDLGINVVTISRPSMFPFGWFTYTLMIYKLINNYEIDILHIYLGWTHLLEVAAGKISRVKAILTTRRGRVSEINGIRLLIRRFTNSLVDDVIVNSKFILTWSQTREKWKSELGTLIYNGVNINQQTNEVSHYRTKFSAPIVTYVASLTTVKRHMDLLLAAEIIKKTNTDISFLIVGDGYERDNMEKFIAEKNLSKYVHLLGYRDDVQEILFASQISINCSISECNSNAILESMVQGVPVIATSIEGNVELVKDHYNGRLIPPHNPKLLAATILELVSDPDTARMLGKNGRKIIERSFTQEKMVNSTLAVYKRYLY